MTDNTDDLIVQLSNRIGIAMEDASVTALQIRRVERSARAGVVAELETATARMTALTAAIKALIA